MLIEDIDKCVGCHICENACKNSGGEEHSNGCFKVEQIGPEYINEKIVMRYILRLEEGYNLCSYEKIKGDMSCIQLCPTDAIMIVTDQELLSLINEGRSIQVLKRVYIS